MFQKHTYISTYKNTCCCEDLITSTMILSTDSKSFRQLFELAKNIGIYEHTCVEKCIPNIPPCYFYSYIALYHLTLDYTKYESSCHTHKETASKRVLTTSKVMKMKKVLRSSQQHEFLGTYVCMFSKHV